MLSSSPPPSDMLNSKNVMAVTTAFANAKDQEGDPQFVNDVLPSEADPDPAPQYTDMLSGRRKYPPDFDQRPANYDALSAEDKQGVDDVLPLTALADARFHADTDRHAKRLADANASNKALLREVMALAGAHTVGRLQGTPANAAAMAVTLQDRPLMFFRALRALFTGGDNAVMVATAAAGIPKMDGPHSFHPYRERFVKWWANLRCPPGLAADHLKAVFFMAGIDHTVFASLLDQLAILHPERILSFAELDMAFGKYAQQRLPEASEASDGNAFMVASKSKGQLKREKAAEAKEPKTAVTAGRRGPGDPTKPHCPDCAKRGDVYNDHGTSTTRPCHRGGRGGVYVAASSDLAKAQLAAAQSDLQDRLDAEDRRAAAVRTPAAASYTAADVQRLIEANLAAVSAYQN